MIRRGIVKASQPAAAYSIRSFSSKFSPSSPLSRFPSRSQHSSSSSSSSPASSSSRSSTSSPRLWDDSRSLFDPFASFNLFRRQIDRMFSEFDRQVLGSSAFLDVPVEGEKKQLSGKEGGDEATSSSSSLAPRPSSSLFPSPLDLFSFAAPSALPRMKLDIAEEKDKYVVTADVPGFSREQIKLTVKDGMLTVSGETKNEKEEKDENRRFHRVERSSGSIYRSIRLPGDVKEEQITATCENGVLKVTLPKDENKAKHTEKSIEIQ